MWNVEAIEVLIAQAEFNEDYEEMDRLSVDLDIALEALRDDDEA